MDKNKLHTLDPKEEIIKLINQTYNTYHSKTFKLICYEYGLYKTKSSLLLLPLV